MASESMGPDINIGGRALGAIWSLNALAIIIVIARCLTQRYVSRQLGLSDALVVVSMCTISSMAALITVQYHYGWGRHYAYLDVEDRVEAMKYNAIGQSFGVMGSTFGRLSFIILMLQLFGITKWRRVALWTLFCAQLIPNCVVVITLYIQCDDVRALWDFSIKSACWPEDLQTYIGYAHSGWNGLTDLFLTCLPATMLWSLQMNKRTKFGLVFLLSLSLLAFIGVIMKIVYLEALADRGDYTYNTVPLFVWVQVESTLVVIASSVPLLRPLFLQVKSSTTHHRTRSAGNSYELSNYARKKSLPSNHVFSMISDEEVSGKKENDTGSEVQILPIEQETDSWKGIKKEITYSVKVDDAGAIDIEKGEKQELDHDNGRTTPWLERQVMNRTSKGSVRSIQNARLAAAQ